MLNSWQNGDVLVGLAENGIILRVWKSLLEELS